MGDFCRDLAPFPFSGEVILEVTDVVHDQS